MDEKSLYSANCESYVGTSIDIHISYFMILQIVHELLPSCVAQHAICML